MAYTVYYSFVCVKRKTLLAVNQSGMCSHGSCSSLPPISLPNRRVKNYKSKNPFRAAGHKKKNNNRSFPDIPPYLPLPLLFLARGILLKWVVPRLKSTNTRPVFTIMSFQLSIFQWHSEKERIKSDSGITLGARAIHFPSKTRAASARCREALLYDQWWRA